jgi:hypothetical protein
MPEPVRDCEDVNAAAKMHRRKRVAELVQLELLAARILAAASALAVDDRPQFRPARKATALHISRKRSVGLPPGRAFGDFRCGGEGNMSSLVALFLRSARRRNKESGTGIDRTSLPFAWKRHVRERVFSFFVTRTTPRSKSISDQIVCLTSLSRSPVWRKNWNVAFSSSLHEKKNFCSSSSV